MSSKSIEVPSGNTSSEFVHNELSNNDLDRPIALRKGVISCTKYPIYNFVSYKGLSPSFLGFCYQSYRHTNSQQHRRSSQTTRMEDCYSEKFRL